MGRVAPVAGVEDTGLGRDAVGDLIGLEYLELGGDGARARAPVSESIQQPFGLVHGGVYSAMAESMCSRATWVAVKDDGMAAMGQSNNATFLRPIMKGFVNAVATPRHQGRTSWVWDVDFTDEDDRLCAIVRVTIAVRPMPDA
jgi:1,4-dihydroxy-2-naphthoyl-CoA hydrolase